MSSIRPSIAEQNDHKLALLKEMFVQLLPQEQADYFNQRWLAMSGNLPSLQVIANVVCQEFDISMNALRGAGGTNYVSDARKVYSRIAYDIGYKWEDIGAFILQSHPGVLKSAKRLGELTLFDDDASKALREKYERVQQTIQEIS